MKTKAIIAAFAAVVVAGSAWAGAGDTLKERLGQTNADGVYQLAQSCSGAGSRYCSPGSIAAGGCYNPAYSRCHEGMICPNGHRICTVDQKGYPTPYCYDPSRPNTCRE